MYSKGMLSSSYGAPTVQPSMMGPSHISFGVYGFPPQNIETQATIQIPISNYQPSYAALSTQPQSFSSDYQNPQVPVAAPVNPAQPILATSPTYAANFQQQQTTNYGAPPVAAQPVYPVQPAPAYAPQAMEAYEPYSMPTSSYKVSSVMSSVMDADRTITWTIPYEDGVSRFVSMDSSSFSNVRKISFKNLQIGDSGCEQLCRYLISNKFYELKKLNLTNCSLTDFSLNSLLTLVQNRPLPKLKEINLSENSISDSSIETISSISMKKVEVVHDRMKNSYSMVKPIAATSPETMLHGVLTYQVHVESLGWLSVTGENTIAGHIGKNKKIECIRLFYSGPGEIQIMGHVQDVGWMKPVQANQDCGTTGKGKRLEAIRAWFTGISGLHLAYRVFVEKKGWQTWVRDGAVAGTTGQGKRLEAVQFKFI